MGSFFISTILLSNGSDNMLKQLCRGSLVREGGGLENHWWQHLGSSNLPFGVHF